MITGAHVVVESEDPEADRAFVRDVLGFDSVDVGGGWLIFALPQSELAFHPGANGHHQLFLMCENLEATIRELNRRGVTVNEDISEQRWGRLASFRLPGGGELAIYQPSHARPAS